MAPIELFLADAERSKITLMLEECELPYDIKYVDLSKQEQFEPDFLKISPNGRMPAIVDPEGSGGAPISIFESGAILQYLGNKTGKYYPADQLARSEVEQWLFWQMGGLGPMAGQAAHFRNYKADKIDYAIERYTNEVIRLYGVMEGRLANRDFLAGDFSIADMACWLDPRIQGVWHRSQGIRQFAGFGFKRVGARPAVERAANIGRMNSANAKSARKGQSRSIGDCADRRRSEDRSPRRANTENRTMHTRVSENMKRV